jgi:hypothetical protein
MDTFAMDQQTQFTLTEFFNEAGDSAYLLLDAISKFRDINAKLKYVNALQQEHFDEYMDRYNCHMSATFITGLDSQKFKTYVPNAASFSLFACPNFAFLDKIISNGFEIDIGFWRAILGRAKSMETTCNKQQRLDYEKLIQTMLFFSDNDLIEKINFTKYPTLVSNIVNKFHENKRQMLELELQTKDVIAS